MAEIIPPAAPATPAPTPANMAAPLGKASDLLKEVAAGAAPGTTPPAGAVEGEKPAETPAPAEPDETSRLARIAKEQRRLEKKQQAWKQEQKDIVEAAQSWKKLQEAKTGKGRMAALELLFDAGEIEAGLYEELTERIYRKGDGATTMTKAEADQLVEAKLAAARKADDDARTKKDQDAVQTKEAEAQATTAGYLEYVNATFQADTKKYPILAAVLEDLPEAISGKDIQAYAEAHFKEHGQAPTGDEVLAHFEVKLSKKFTPAKIEDPADTAPVPKTVTSSWGSDPTPRDPNRKMSLAEITAQAKREAGING